MASSEQLWTFYSAVKYWAVSGTSLVSLTIEPPQLPTTAALNARGNWNDGTTLCLDIDWLVYDQPIIIDSLVRQRTKIELCSLGLL